MDKYIVHLDMDAFFAAVEQRDNPVFSGKPVIIGADPKRGRGRGVVSTASYQARKFGIASAMPISAAYKRCPQGVFLRPNLAKYSRVSKQIYSILYQFTPLVEPVGIDEAFLDISGSFNLFGTPAGACLKLKEKIKKEVKLTASAGLAPIKMAAKIASDLNKPDGFLEVKKENLLEFLWPLKIEKLWGVGQKTKTALNRMGIKSVGDLAKFNRGVLKKVFGKNGEHLWQLANGADQRKVEVPDEAKSIGNEFTFSEDTADKDLIKAVLSSLSERVSGRLRKSKLKAKGICLKIRLEDFSTHTRAMQLNKSTNFYETIYKAASVMYEGSGFSGKKIRLLGVKTSHFINSNRQDAIFEELDEEKKIKTDKALDRIKEKFGESYIQRGMSLYRNKSFEK